jgi:sialate O-acetylesterase
MGRGPHRKSRVSLVACKTGPSIAGPARGDCFRAPSVIVRARHGPGARGHTSYPMNAPSLRWIRGCALLAAALVALPLQAALTVNPIFRSNMVLQRNTSVPVFGTASPNQAVTVSFLNQTVNATADATGKWRANLASMAANSGSNTLIVSTSNENATFTGVQVGEVWLCSGQSNMGWSLDKADGSAPYISSAGSRNIRLFRMTAGSGPATASWVAASPTTVGSFSAVGYWMGLDLSHSLNVPIGLIQATHDGTNISEWQHTNGGGGADYDAMVKSIQPFAVRGVAWYQGESNGGDSAYEKKLTDLIAEWRADWQLPNLPFGIIQLTAQKWTTARLAQYNVSRKVAGTFLVVTHDLPGGSMLHPTAKYLVGIRTSIGARGSVYGENIVWSGPVPASFSVSGTTVTVSYSHAGSGLVTSNGGAPSPYAVIAGTGRAKAATGTITGTNTVTLATSTAGVTRVQYAMSALGNVFNIVSIPTEGGAKTVDRLPASLFDLTQP